MSYYQYTETHSKELQIHIYQGVSKHDFDLKIDELFHSRGYSIKEGEPGDAVYEKGNRVTRILLGAFVKYFKFKLQTVAPPDSDKIRLNLIKETSGMSGGAIGVGQVKTEMDNLATALKAL